MIKTLATEKEFNLGLSHGLLSLIKHRFKYSQEAGMFFPGRCSDAPKVSTKNSHEIDTETHPALLKLSGITEKTVMTAITE